LNKPTIPAAQVNSNWTATTGVASILNKPSIPSTYTDVGAASSNHTHGAITSDGTIAATNTAIISSGDRLVFTDSSDSNKVKVSSITFSPSGNTNQYLTPSGTWEFLPHALICDYNDDTCSYESEILTALHTTF